MDAQYNYYNPLVQVICYMCNLLGGPACVMPSEKCLRSKDGQPASDTLDVIPERAQYEGLRDLGIPSCVVIGTEGGST